MSDPNNKRLDLNGKYFFVKDSREKFDLNQIKNLFEDGKTDGTMILPVNWELAGLHNFNGAVWFIKEFEINFSKEALSILHFLGVDYFAEAWLNWNYIGKHEGYFSPFSFSVSKFLERKNILAVKVTSPYEEPETVWPDKKRTIKGIFSHHDCRPGGNSKEHGQDQNTGGIWNDVYIEYGNKVIVETIKITSSINGDFTKAFLKAAFSILSPENLFEQIPVSFQIISPANEVFEYEHSCNLKPGANKVYFDFTITSPDLWWNWDLGKANLYQLKISSEYFSTKEISFGIREFHLDDNQQFFINGKKLFLRGTNIIPTQFLSDFKKDKIEKVVSLMKEANINIVRVHAHVNRKEFYDECDKQGIIVWQDFSLQWTYDESDSFKSEAVKQIKEMVNHLYNHAGIAFWCCHNEPGSQIKTLDPLLEEAVKQEDKTRIVRRASNYEEHAYDGWYWGKKEHYAAAPMGPLVTEFGAQALPNLDSLKEIVGEKNLFYPDWKVWEYHNFQVDQTFNIAKIEMGNSIETFIDNSRDYQSEVLKTAIDFYRRKRFTGINGIFQFMLIDCWQSITWSVVDYYGMKKKAFDTLRNCYQPVYISINLRQDQYYAGKKFLIDLYLINDLHIDFKSCDLKFCLDKSEIHQIKNLCLKENQMIFINYESFSIKVPQSFQPGNYKMELELFDNVSKKIISENSFCFKVVDLIK